MTWVHRAEPSAHTCEPPMRSVVVPDGKRGDLWRCHCGSLWRIGAACDWCNRHGADSNHPGQCTVGTKWRPASLWQRIRYFRHRDGHEEDRTITDVLRDQAAEEAARAEAPPRPAVAPDWRRVLAAFAVVPPPPAASRIVAHPTVVTAILAVAPSFGSASYLIDRLAGIPIFPVDTLPPGTWRIVDGVGNTLHEGNVIDWWEEP